MKSCGGPNRKLNEGVGFYIFAAKTVCSVICAILIIVDCETNISVAERS